MSETIQTCGCCGAPVRQTMSQGLPSVEYVPPVPDTRDTAALDDLLDDWNSAGIAFGQSCSATNEQRVRNARAAIHERLAAVVQAEREEYFRLLMALTQEDTYVIERVTRNAIALRSTPSDNTP